MLSNRLLSRSTPPLTIYVTAVVIFLLFFANTSSQGKAPSIDINLDQDSLSRALNTPLTKNIQQWFLQVLAEIPGNRWPWR